MMFEYAHGVGRGTGDTLWVIVHCKCVNSHLSKPPSQGVAEVGGWLLRT